MKINEVTKKDPCWKGYKQVGTKKKGNKQVPNCVPEDQHYADENAVAETATAGGTSAGAIAAVPNPKSARSKVTRDKYGLPVAPQIKNKDGTAKNAQDVDMNLMGGGTVKR